MIGKIGLGRNVKPLRTLLPEQSMEEKRFEDVSREEHKYIVSQEVYIHLDVENPNKKKLPKLNKNYKVHVMS